MNKIAIRLLPLILLVVCCSASAEWTKTAETDSNVFFVDFGTLRINGKIRKVWALINSNDGGSMKGYEEHDCKNEKWRVVQISTHSEHFGKGIVESTKVLTNEPWAQVSPMAAEEIVHRAICKK